MRTQGHRLVLAVLAAATFAASVLTSRWLFPLYTANRDDSVYVAMARLLERGHVTLPAAGQEFFRPWASGVVGDRLVLKYTPPWPAVLAAADALTGSTVVGLGLTAAATVVVVAVLAGEVFHDRATGVVAGVLLALSPLFLAQSATYLPYVFQLLLELGFAALLLIGVRRGSTVRVAASGAVLGVAAFARPFDAVLFAIPVVLVVLVDAGRGSASGTAGHGWTWWGTGVRLALGAVPVLALSLLYNTLVMGSPFRLPFTVTGPQDAFGFGRRGVFPEWTIPFEPDDAVTGLVTNLRWFPSWSFGGILLIGLAVVGLLRSTGRARWALAGLALTFPLGYFAFWGPYAIARLWQGVQGYGPFYHLPALVPLVAFGAVPLVALWRSTASRARVLTAVAAAAMVALTAVAVPDKVALNASIRDDFRAVQRFVGDQDLGAAVLVLPRRGDLGFLSTTPFLENSPTLDQPVLYAEDRGAEDFRLVDRYPGRALYRLSEDLPPGRTTGGPLTLDRLRVTAGSAVVLRQRLTNPTDRPVAEAYLRIGETVWSQPLDQASARGRTYDVTWTLTAPGSATSSAPGAVALPADPASGLLAAGLSVRPPGQAASGADRRWERRTAFRLAQGSQQVQLLGPGTGWTHGDSPGADWTELAAGNPVAETGS